MTDDVKQALAWADSMLSDFDLCGHGADITADEAFALSTLVAELRRLDGQRCETCKHRVQLESACTLPFCGKLSPQGPGVVFCEDVLGCRAHEPKA